MFNFTSSVFAAEVPVTTLNGLRVQSTANPTTIVSGGDLFKGCYFPIRQGLTYTCDFGNSDTTNLRSVFTTQIPSVGVTAYDFNGGYDGLNVFSFISNYDGYCYFFDITDVTVTVQDDIDTFDLLPVKLSNSPLLSISSTSFASGTSNVQYAYLEANVEYTLTIINSSSSGTSCNITYSSNIPYVGGNHTGIIVQPVMSGPTSLKVIGQNNYLCVSGNSNLSFTLGTMKKKDNVTLEDLEESINNNDSAIINGQENINNSINEQGDKIEDAMTSTEYDENTINIDTSVTDDIDDSATTGLFTTVFDNLSNLISSSNWSTVEVINIGIPFTDANIQLRSDLLSKIVGNSLLATLINVAWYSLFGLYVFRFSTNIFHAIKSGDILNGLNLNNEVISSTML